METNNYFQYRTGREGENQLFIMFFLIWIIGSGILLWNSRWIELLILFISVGLISYWFRGKQT